MEFLLDLLPALFIFWFIIRGLRGSGRRRRQAPSNQPQRVAAGRPATAFSGFEELVRRLEEAAAEAQQRQQPAIQVAPPALTRSFEPPPPAPALADDDEFRPVESAVSEFSYVGGIGEGVQATEFHETHPLDVEYRVPGVATSGPAAPVRAHPLVERLRSPTSAREALLLKDVLSPPRSRSWARR